MDDPRQIRPSSTRPWWLLLAAMCVGIATIGGRALLYPPLTVEQSQAFADNVIVPALLEYRAETGRWPASLAEAIDRAGVEDLPRPAMGGWFYYRSLGDSCGIGFGPSETHEKAWWAWVFEGQDEIRWTQNSD